jgi:hypothetical protein
VTHVGDTGTHPEPSYGPVIGARVDAAAVRLLAEVERRIEAWIRHGEAVPSDVTTYDRGIVHAELRMLIQDARAATTETPPACGHVYPDGTRCTLTDHSAPGLAAVHGPAVARDTGDSETTVEWNLINAEGEPFLQPWSEDREEVESYIDQRCPFRLVSRERTRTPDRVTDWQEVPADDGVRG